MLAPGQIQQARQQHGPRDAICQRVVHLDDHGGATVSEPLDRPQLPERPRAIESLAGEQLNDFCQLALAARRGHRYPVKVAVQVEVRILDPHWVL